MSGLRSEKKRRRGENVRARSNGLRELRLVDRRQAEGEVALECGALVAGENSSLGFKDGLARLA